MNYIFKATLTFSLLLFFSFSVQAQQSKACSSKAVQKICAKVCDKGATAQKAADSDMVKTLFTLSTNCSPAVAKAANCKPAQCDPADCEPSPQCCKGATAQKKSAKVVTASLVTSDRKLPKSD